MQGLVREEIFTTIKKKRFVILTVLLFIGFVAAVIVTKNKYLNDLTYLFKVRKFIFLLFNPIMGSTLLFSVHRRKYTRTSILQAQDHGVKRGRAVLSRVWAGTVLLFFGYLLMAVFAVLMSFILGAHITFDQFVQLMTEIMCNWLAAVTTYIVCLFWQYLFAFPLIPIALYIALMFVGPWIFYDIENYANIAFRIVSFISAKCNMDIFYTSILLNNPQWYCLLVCLAHIVPAILFTMLVFKIKKLKDKKKKKKKCKKGEESEEDTAAEGDADVSAETAAGVTSGSAADPDVSAETAAASSEGGLT